MPGLAFLSKKSWHTSNFANIEKVWLAEQSTAAEEVKTKELARQIQQEREADELYRLAGQKPKERMDRGIDWMYQSGGPRVGTAQEVQFAAEYAKEQAEQYLLGKEYNPEKIKGGDFSTASYSGVGVESVIRSRAVMAKNGKDESEPYHLQTDPSGGGPQQSLPPANQVQTNSLQPVDWNENFRLRYEDPMYLVAQKKMEREKETEKKRNLLDRVSGAYRDQSTSHRPVSYAEDTKYKNQMEKNRLSEIDEKQICNKERRKKRHRSMKSSESSSSTDDSYQKDTRARKEKKRERKQSDRSNEHHHHSSRHKQRRRRRHSKDKKHRHHRDHASVSSQSTSSSSVTRHRDPRREQTSDTKRIDPYDNTKLQERDPSNESKPTNPNTSHEMIPNHPHSKAHGYGLIHKPLMGGNEFSHVQRQESDLGPEKAWREKKQRETEEFIRKQLEHSSRYRHSMKKTEESARNSAKERELALEQMKADGSNRHMELAQIASASESLVKERHEEYDQEFMTRAEKRGRGNIAGDAIQQTGEFLNNIKAQVAQDRIHSMR